MRLLMLGVLPFLVIACRSDPPPVLSVICIADGFGGMDCSVSDGSHKHMLPSETKGMWCTTQADQVNFAAWCYDTKPKIAEGHMEAILADIEAHKVSSP